MAQNQNTVYVGNLSEKVTEDLLYELFLQAGPVVNVTIPKQKAFGFVHFKHQCSVPYVVSLLDGVTLFGKTLKVAPRGGLPTGYSPNMGPIMQRPIIHPLSQHGHLASMEPRNSRKGGRHNGDEDADLRDRLKPRSRTNDPMMPSARISKRADAPFEKDMEAIPDFLGSGFDPLYSSGPFVPPYQIGARDDMDRSGYDRNHRRQDQDDGFHHRGRNDGHHHSHQDKDRRDRRPYHSSNRRKHF